MNVKNVWLLSFLALMLVFGVISSSIASIVDVEVADATGQYNRNNFAIPGSLILLEGRIGGTVSVNLGNLMLGPISIKPGAIDTGGHALIGASGTKISGTGEVSTNNQGDYSVTFILPFDLLPGAYTGANGFRFVNNAAEPNTQDFSVQVPVFNDIRANYRDDDVFKNGDTISYDVRLQDSSNEQEAVTLLVDFRGIDDSFGAGVPNMPAMNVPPVNWNQLTAIETATKAAITANKLIVEDRGRGDYTVSYTIPLNSTANPGAKRITIYGVDYPSRFTVAQIKNIFQHVKDNVNDWTAQTDPLLFAHLNIVPWMNGVEYPFPATNTINDFRDRNEAPFIELDNTPPGFNFAMIDPFTNSSTLYTPPKTIWIDKNNNNVVDKGEVNYAFKPGDKVSIMVQVNPFNGSLNQAEFERIDSADITDDMVSRNGIRGIQFVGDISALLDPTKVNLTTDLNNNGIPDAAEVVASYAGSSNGDDDLDKDDTRDGVDDADFTTNGFYEPYMFVVTFTIDEKFRGASGTNPVTVTDLPFRFMIQDSAGNQGHFSSGYEVYDPVSNNWVPSANWARNTDLDNADTVPTYFPVRADDATYNDVMINGPFAHIPDASLFPVWDSGHNIVANWKNPWLIRIDNWAPSVSRIDGLNLKVQAADALVMNGAAVVSEVGVPSGNPLTDGAVLTGAPTQPNTFFQHTAPSIITDAGQNVLSNMGTSNFIYEISGNENNLVSLRASFPSDNDIDHVVFEYSDTDTTGSYKPMKGVFAGDRDIFAMPDMAGNWTDAGVPGAAEGRYHDGISGDDDSDNDADLNDSQVRAAMLHPQSDGIDNDGDGLVDSADVDINGNNTDVYDPSRDDDEDAIMDEDACIVRTASPATWTFDPVRIARVLRLTPGKSYAIKAFAYDKAGNVLESSAAPIFVIFNVVGKGVQEIQGTAKATISKGGQAVTGKFIPENNQYVLEATTTGTVNSVTFQYSMDGKNWGTIADDLTAPFKVYWTPTLQALADDLNLFVDLNHNGKKWTDVNANGIYDKGIDTIDPGESYVVGQDLFIRAVPTKIGNLGKYKPTAGMTPDLTTFIPYDPVIPGFASAASTGTPDITVAVTDSTAPVLVITKAGTPGNIDNDMSDGALLQVAQDVTITAEAIVANVYANDYAEAVFQYAMSSPDGTIANWVNIPGTVDKYILPVPGDPTRTLIQAVVKWDTTALVPGNTSIRFDLRCVAKDIAGNSDPQLAPIVHVVVGKGKYAAFISDPNNGQSISGTSYTVEAFIYNKNTAPETSSIKTVIFQFLSTGGIWTNIDSVANGTPLTGTADSRGIKNGSHGMVQMADFSVWHGNWDIRDLSGDIKIRARVEDDRGYINDGIEIAVKVTGVSVSRANISNFVSDATKNPRVSKQIARAGTVADITIVDPVGNLDDTLQVVLKAAIASGTAEKVEFQYLVNPSIVQDPSINPKKDPPTSLWTTIGTDTDGSDGWAVTWKITAATAPELFNSKVAKLVYVRAVAWKTAADAGSKDKYTDESNFVPYVGLIFEELHNPTANFQKIIVTRDGVDKDMGSYAPSVSNNPATWLDKEMRVTGGTVTFEFNPLDQATEDQRAESIAKVELFYKPYYKPSVNPDNTAVSFWTKAVEDATAPFALVWDISKITSGKYEIMLVATDQVGNKSANIFNVLSNAGNTGLRNLGIVKILNIDLEGPLSYIEDPDATHHGKLVLDGSNNGLMTIAVGSSCNGGVKLVKVYYSLQPAIPPDVRTGEGTYTFQYLDLNNNGQYDPGEPFYLINPPGQGSGIPTVPTGQPSWVEIATITIDYSQPPFNFGTAKVYSKFFDFASSFGYYYYDANGDGKYEVGEPVWKDDKLTGGNIGRYNNNARTIAETVVLGASTPPDEAPGLKFEDLAGLEFPVQLCTGTASGVVKWADIDGDGLLSKNDFIWIDLNGDNKFTWTDGKNINPNSPEPGGMAEPIVYAPIPVTWPALSLLDIPPTNNSTFDLRTLAQDRNDSVNNDGNWGPEYTGKVRIENIKTQITAVNTKALADYKADTSLWRVTGNTVNVTVRVWPRPIDGAKVQLWFRYDNKLYPAGNDADSGDINLNYNGIPNNGLIANSRYDGIDNDWDGVIDEDQADQDGNTHDPDWGEANTWQLAQTTGGTTVTATGAADNIIDNKWFEVKLTWDVSMLKDEFQYEVVPVVVDGQNYGTRFHYASLPWTTSDARFPQGAVADNIINIIVDHQGPYTYTQAVVNTDGIGDTERTLDSWTALSVGSPDDLIVRTNDHIRQSDGVTDAIGPGNLGDETDNNFVVYDVQAKTVSIFGGLSYTKTFADKIDGVEIQYRDLTHNGPWVTLGFDYDPDYMSSFYYDNAGKLVEDPAPNLDRGLANSLGWVGAFITYYGKAINASAGNAATVITANTQRVVEATWSIDNGINVLDIAKFPWTNGTEYEFRAIAKDLPDAWGSPGIITNGDITTATAYDEYVIRGIVGADGVLGNNAQASFLRDIYWKLGVPFNFVGAKTNIFNQPITDGVNNRMEFVLGPRDDGKDSAYWVDNIVPKASIIRVDEKTFAWTPEAGVDPTAVANAVDAEVMEGDDVLVEAIVNADPEKRLGASLWGTGQPAAGDITQVQLWGRSGNRPPGWKIVAMGVPSNVGGGMTGQSDYGNSYTFRVDTAQVVKDLGIANAGTRDVTLAAVAVDDNGNQEGLVGEIVIRINDLIGPKIKLGGLALDVVQLKYVLDHSSDLTGVGSTLASFISNTLTGGIGGSIFDDPKFVDTVNLDLTNFGNAVFPSYAGNFDIAPGGTTVTNIGRPATKVSGEVLNLYLYNPRRAFGEIPANGVTITVYDKNNTPVVKKTADYSIDKRIDDNNVAAALIPHTFVLSENSARIYLPTWVDNGKTKSRFEGVKMFYAIKNNVALPAGLNAAPSDLWTGTTLTPPNQPFGDSVNLTPSFNSKGEPIWSVVMNLEAGKTYYYYFVVDTVGDTWVIPDPKNMSFDIGTGSLVDFWIANQKYIMLKNWYINLPVMSKLWVPGTAKENNVVDDEFWYATINLDGLADGGYEVRVDVKDSAGYISQAAVSKTIVVDRTPPAVDSSADIKVAGRVKANSSTPLTAVLHDQPGVNAVDTFGVLFEVSRETKNHQGGNTQEATSTWQYAISTEDRPLIRPELQSMIDTLISLNPEVQNFNWLRKIAFDVDSADGWSIPWQTPMTDQNVKYFVRAVPIDDVLNVQVDQTNQVEVWVDGTMPKAKILTASLSRNGSVVTDGADGFEILPTDKNVTLTARIEANSDGDLNLDGIIDSGAGEDANHGVKSVSFEYTLRELSSLNTNANIIWYPIPATQYSNSVLAPNADGSWSVTWQVDFSKLYNAEKDQYIYLRAVAEDEVGNKDATDPILAVMVLNDVTGPAVQIKQIKGPLCGVAENALSPHLAVSRGITDVYVKFTNKVAAIKLAYRAVGAADWTEIKTLSRTLDATKFTDPLMTIPWDTSRLEAGKYDLQATGYDSDGNPTPDPHSITVIVDYTEPVVTIQRIGAEIAYDSGDSGTWFNYETTIDPATGIFRYARQVFDKDGQPSGYLYHGVQITVKADATDPTDKVEAKTVTLQYFDRSSATWQTVKYADGVNKGKDVTFAYSKATDLWTATFVGDDPRNINANTGLSNAPGLNALGRLIPGLKDGVDGELWLRALAIDYACNDNKLDKGMKLIADANPPNVIAVYSGGRGYEGGSTPTIIANGGDPVDLWAKATDAGGAGIGGVTFHTISTLPIVPAPPYANDWFDIGAGAKYADNGANSEELWHLLWNTPKNMPAGNELYIVAVTVTDKAGNSTVTKTVVLKQAQVKVEKDVTVPDAPIVTLLDTHGNSGDIFKYPSMASYEPGQGLVQVFNELNAANYSQKKRLIIEGDNYKKYEVFNTFYVDENADGVEDNGTDNVGANKIDSRKDTKLVVFTNIKKLEYGSQVGTNRDPSLDGSAKVYVEYAYDPNQDGDPSDITAWTKVFNNTADETVTDNFPLIASTDIRWVPIRDADGNIIAYNYYFVMGDNSAIAGFADNTNERVIDTAGWADGLYIFRTKSVDNSGNTSPYGYGKFLVHNKDIIAPARTTIFSLNGTDDTTRWVPLEWKWHKVIVRTYRNAVGPWWMGATGRLTDPTMNPSPIILNPPANYPRADYGAVDARNRFFNDINNVYVEVFDNESQTWVNITKDAKATGGGVASSGDDSFAGLNDDRSRFFTEWTVWIDSTAAGDGNTKMRPRAVDNASVAAVAPTGIVEAVDPAKEKAIMIDNPRAQVVLPASGTVVERGVTDLTVQAVPVELAGWDVANNGHDVGQMVFLVKRKAASNGGINGPWILLDAKDNDLDGRFGEDPVVGKDYDKDGKTGEDGVDPSDTNEPYMVHWKIPDWLVIDDPQTEKVVEQTADYWVVGVAGDSNTGPLDSKAIGNDPDGAAGPIPAISANQIHYDNPDHIIAHTNRAALVTIVDNHPPRTRILQVGAYKVPSETKMVVGKTVTLFAGDTEVDWVPPGTFPTADLYSYPPSSVINAAAWPADAAAWSYGMLYPTLYNPDAKWENELYKPAWAAGKPAEWRPNGRITLRYAGPYASDAVAPAFPTSGQSWDDTAWKSAEADAIHMDVDNATGDPTGLGNPGVPKWQVTNWVTGDPVLPDGKYFITVTATDDVGHTTGVPVGSADPVVPDVAEIWIKNTTKPIQLAASQLLVDGTLVAITNKEMERGEPLVLSVDPKMSVEDLDKVTFQFKAQHDYDWKDVKTANTQPYSATLSPVGGWDGQTATATNIVLGAVYQFKAVGIDSIGNKTESNIIELTVVDNKFMASIAKIKRIDGTNGDEMTLYPRQINQTNDYPKLTGRVCFTGYTDSDVVGVQFLYRAQGTTTWTDIEALVSRSPEAPSWDGTSYSYTGMNGWTATWDTTTLQDGVYQVAIIAVPWSLTTGANTGQKMPEPSDILNVVVDHNAYDILDNITDNTPKDGDAVGGWTRRPVASQNPILTPDQKEMIGPRGEVDLWVTFGKGLGDLDMGVPTGTLAQGNGQGSNIGTALKPSIAFEYKESTYPNVGDATKDDSSYWKPINADAVVVDVNDTSYHRKPTDVVYDAATKRISTIWPTAGVCHNDNGETVQIPGARVLNGYYDIRIVIDDEAGNTAYKVIARRVIVDNTAPDAVISNVNGDTTLTYSMPQIVPESGNSNSSTLKMATDTELTKGSSVVIRTTAVDSLTSVAYVQYQVMPVKLSLGLQSDDVGSTANSTVGIGDVINNNTLNEWVDIGLATKDADPKDSYSLLWDTTGLFEGDYKLRVKATDRVGNMDYSGEVLVTVIDTTPPIASIVGYYPNQLHFLNWPKKYWFDTLYAATICQADIQEVQFQYRSISDPKWITIGVPVGHIETVSDKLGEVSKIVKTLFPTTLAATEAITELFNWTSLWGTTWSPNLPDGTYQLRAVAKDWSGNIAPELAPILTVSSVNGVIQPVTPGSGIKIDFTANLGGTGVGDRSAQGIGTPSSDLSPNYTDVPTVVVEVDSPEKPIVFMLYEFQAPVGLSFNGGQVMNDPNGLVVAGELLDMMPVQGEVGKYKAALTGGELPCMTLGDRQFTYLDLLRYGGKIIAFATTSSGSVSTSLMTDDLKIYPVTAELGTNGTAFSKDGNVAVTIPRAALIESQPFGDKTFVEKMGLMVTPVITPNTPKNQRLIIQPVGQAYSIDFFDYWSDSGVIFDGVPAWAKVWGFRPGFEPKVTIDYSGAGIPADIEANGFISVRYWQPQEKNDSDSFGVWANDDIINLSVDTNAKKISFNLKKFGSINDAGNLVPHTIYSIVLEKSLGRVDAVTFFGPDRNYKSDMTTLGHHEPKFENPAFRYHADPSISYLSNIECGYIQFRIVDPAGIDRNSIKLYIDGQLYGAGSKDFHVAGEVTPDKLETDKVFYFNVPEGLALTEGDHVVKIDAWDKSDAVNEADWQQLEATARLFIDRTPPQVVTQGAQKDGIRYFKAPEGAIAAITLVDEGVGLSAADLQRYINVDVFKWLNAQTTSLRTTDQGNIINYQRKTLIATSKPVIEYADNYTPDGIDNETWNGITDGASDQRHKAWRASYNIQVGNVVDGETYEVVFYAQKPQPMVLDLHNENAVYLYEDLTKAYLAVWKGDTADNLSVSADKTLEGIVSVPATQVPDFYQLGIANLITTADPFTGYYQGTFLNDILGNGAGNGYIAPLPGIVGNIINGSNPDGGSGGSDQSSLINTANNAVSTAVTSSSSSSSYYSGDISYFVRHLVADTRGPIVTLSVPQGVKADDPASTVSANIIDDGSGIADAQLVINGVVKAEKKGPISNVTLDYTFGKGEVVGANEIKVVVTDLAGNETVTRGSFGVQEMDAPVISDMSPVGDGIADATPTISAAYSDTTGIDLSSVTLTLNGAVLTDVTVGQSKVSYTPTSPLKASVVYTVKLAVKDKAGVPSEKIWTFSLEKDAPVISDTTPTGVDNTGMPLISAKYSDAGTGINKDSATLKVDNLAVNAQVTDTGISFKSSTVMAKGKHTAEVTVADKAGNVATLAWDFSIEEVIPVISDVMPSGAINDDMPILSAKYSDAGTGINLSSVTMTLNGDVVSATVGAGEVSYSVKEPLKPNVGYTVGIRVSDKAGNEATATSSFKLEVTAPVISGMSPTGIVQSVDVAVSANYSDAGAGIDLTTALMKVDGVVVNANASASGISYQATKLTHGDHTVFVEVADKFGNAANQNWTFKVEETPPVIATVEPDGEVNTATPVLKATYSDAGTGVNVGSVVLSLNGQILPAMATATQVSYEILTPLEKGVTYKVSVQVADKAGNIASKDSSFSLETKPPTISGTKPTGTVAEADAAKGITITAAMADDGSGVNPESVKMWVDGAPVVVTATASNATYIAKGLGYGEHNVRLVVADMLNNVADTSWKFSVADSTPPTVTVVSPKQDAVVGVRPVIRISYSDEGSGVDLTSITVTIDDKPVSAGTMAPAKPGDAKVVSAGESSYEVKLGYGSHTLSVAVKDVAGNESTAEVTFMVEGDVLEVVKAHNYPNPFKGDSTKIAFGLSKKSQVSIRVYDFTNTLVATVAEDETKDASEKVEFSWDGTTDAGGGRQLANGVYFAQVVVKTDSETKSQIIKIALVRE